MTIPRLFTSVLTFCFLISLPTVCTPQDNPLFDQSFQLSQKLGGSEQIYFLTALCNASAKSKASPEKTKTYALALLSLGSKQNGESRTLVEKNAVSCLSFADPWAAIDLLPKIYFKQLNPGEVRDEDSRYNSAETTFENLIKTSKSPEAFEKVTTTGRYLGQTGQYPYAGVAKVIDILRKSFDGDVPTSIKSGVETLVNAAVTSFSTESGFQNRDPEFLKLLLALNDRMVDKDSETQAATIFAQRLSDDHIDFPGSYYAEVHLSSNPDSKVFPFTDYKQALIFQAYPQILRLNPSLALQLRQQNPKLAEATDGMIYISGGFFQGDPTSEQATQQRLQWFQQSVLKRIKDRQDCNPQAALNLAQHLTDLNSRIVGLSAPIPAIAQNNPTLAHTIYEEQLSQLGKAGDSMGRLQVTVALAPAAYSVGDLKQYERLANEGFDLGIASVISDTNANRMQNRRGFSQLQELVTFTASQPVDVLQTEVENLPESWLKAYLWVYEAQGHANQKAPPVTTKSCPE